MQALQVALSKHQYDRLRNEAEKRCTSMSDLVLEAIEAYLDSEDAKDRYVRLAHKQAMWRTRQEVASQPQPDGSSVGLVRERTAEYTATPGGTLDNRLADLRLDLVYHSEVLEGSPLTRDQVEHAIRDLSTR